MLESSSSPETAGPAFAPESGEAGWRRVWAWRKRKAVKLGVAAAVILALASPLVFKRGKKTQTWSAEQAPVCEKHPAGPPVKK